MYMYTGERPHAFSICPMRFSDKGSVPRHERTHTGETSEALRLLDMPDALQPQGPRCPA